MRGRGDAVALECQHEPFVGLEAIREPLNCRFHTLWRIQHVTRQLPTQSRPLLRGRVHAPDEEMQHIFKLAHPHLLQSVSPEQQHARLMIPTLSVNTRRVEATHEKLIAVSRTVVFCRPGS